MSISSDIENKGKSFLNEKNSIFLNFKDENETQNLIGNEKYSSKNKSSLISFINLNYF